MFNHVVGVRPCVFLLMMLVRFACAFAHSFTGVFSQSASAVFQTWNRGMYSNAQQTCARRALRMEEQSQHEARPKADRWTKQHEALKRLFKKTLPMGNGRVQ